MNIIEFNNVTKKYGETEALKSFSLKIREGELMVLLGPSGSGKSTCLKLANALIQPDSGEIRFQGQNISGQKPYLLRRQIGYVIQSIGLFPHYSVYKNIAIVPELLKWSKEKINARVEELLVLTGLSLKYKYKFPHELSGGEKQRVGVARALAAEPKILLMDEPFGSLDPINRENMQREFKSIQTRLKKTVVFVTHDIEEAIRIADRIAIIREGRLMGCDTTVNLLEMSRSDAFLSEFLGKDYALKLLSRYTVEDIIKSQSYTETEYSTPYKISAKATLLEALSLMAANLVSKLTVSGPEDEGLSGIIQIEDIFSAIHGETHE